MAEIKAVSTKEAFARMFPTSFSFRFFVWDVGRSKIGAELWFFGDVVVGFDCSVRIAIFYLFISISCLSSL